MTFDAVRQYGVSLFASAGVAGVHSAAILITGRAAPRPNIGNVLLYLDYTAPIERIRNKAIELVGQSTQPAAGSSPCRSPMPRPTPSSCGSC